MSSNPPTSSKLRFKAIIAVYLILKREGKYLFGKRQNTGYMDGFYQPPAGHVDGGESLKTAMAREAKEEIGLIIDEADLTLASVAHRFEKNVDERVEFFFTCKNWNETQIQNMEPEKCSELVWISLDNDNIINTTKTVLLNLEKGINYNEFGF